MSRKLEGEIELAIEVLKLGGQNATELAIKILERILASSAKGFVMTDFSDESFRSVMAKVRSKRYELGLSQGDLAKMLGVSPASIGQWERREVTPRGEAFNKLQEFLND